MRSFTLATRDSALALAQATEVIRLLSQHHPDLSIHLLPLKTTGDRLLDRSFKEAGGKGLFVKEIEEALFDGRADFAVHSMKDVPITLPAGLQIAAILKREDPADVLIANQKISLQTLPPSARVGTSALRRKAQLQVFRPDLKIEDLRGNVQTRLRHLREGRFDAIILALAGLKRLNLESEVTEILPFVSAPGQGAIGVECRQNANELIDVFRGLNDTETFHCVGVERALLSKMGSAGCELPLGIHAEQNQQELKVRVFLQSADMPSPLYLEKKGPLKESATLVELLWNEIEPYSRF